jgi:hypothetical protein
VEYFPDDWEKKLDYMCKTMYLTLKNKVL